LAYFLLSITDVITVLLKLFFHFKTRSR